MDNKNDLALSMSQSLANKFERLYNEEKKKRQEAEGELSIIKGIGMNSPEAIKLKKEICELRQDNRKLAQEVEDRVNRMRKVGM